MAFAVIRNSEGCRRAVVWPRHEIEPTLEVVKSTCIGRVFDLFVLLRVIILPFHGLCVILFARFYLWEPYALPQLDSLMCVAFCGCLRREKPCCRKARLLRLGERHVPVNLQ